jgi:hypothetical protein
VTAGGLRAKGATAAAALVLFVAAWTAGCAARIPPVREVDAAAAQAGWPGTTTADLDRGRHLYVVRCSACHLAHTPSERRSRDWPAVVDKMAPRAKLAAAEKIDVLRYLTVMAESH